MNKKLTADRIKQLEDNANIMKEGGYSDEDIQAMSNQFIEEYGVDDTVAVKKKTHLHQALSVVQLLLHKIRERTQVLLNHNR